jgi:hypothetical protein
MTQGEIEKAWSNSVASLAVSGLLVAKLVVAKDQERAIAIVAEEILVRLCLEDRPDAHNWRYQSK